MMYESSQDATEKNNTNDGMQDIVFLVAMLSEYSR